MLPKNTAIAAFLLDKSRDHISERTEIGLGLSVRFSDQEALQIFRSCNKAKRGLAITTGVISNLDVAWCDGDQFVLHSINGKVYVSIDDSRQPTILMFILPKGIDHAVAALRTIS